MAAATISSLAPPSGSLFPARVHGKPIVRWVGAKRWIVPLVAENVWAKLLQTGGRFFEPFLGGGALALDLGLPRMVLSDVCRDLLVTYREVVADATAVHERMTWLLAQEAPAGVNSKSYYQIRAFTPEGPLDVAARFLILNTTCFNGVYRENQAGVFNVPYGNRTEKHVPKLAALRQLALAFATAELHQRDFRVVLSAPRAGDVVFCDPPYFDTYTGYAKRGFTLNDQQDLARYLAHAVARGVTVLATNSDRPEVHALYADTGLEMFENDEMRKVSCDGKKRQDAACLILTNDPGLLAAQPTQTPVVATP